MKPMLFLEGDSVQREKAITRISERVFGRAQVERRVFQADQGQMDAAIEELWSNSLFDEEKLVILTGLEKLFGKGKKNKDETDGGSGVDKVRSLIEMIPHVREDSPFLIFSETKGGIPKSLLNVFDKNHIVTLPKTSPGDIRKWVEKKCAKAGFSLSDEAFSFFMETCSGNIDAVKQEFEKIELWAEAGQQVSLEACKQLIWGETQEKIWGIANSISAKDPVQSLAAFQKLISQGEEVYSMLGVLIMTFRRIYACKTLQQERVPESQWKEYVALNSYQKGETVQAAKKFTLSALRRALSLLSQADSDIKGGKSDPHLVMERLVVDLCRI